MQLHPGTVVHDLYQLIEPIGRGGNAVIFAARNLEGGQTVALKLLQPLQSERARQRFFRELMLATRVDHPNLVKVHDYGLFESLDAPYIVMDRLHGMPLSRYIHRHGPLALDRCVELFVGALRGLAAGHRKGVVHKDIKPSNLFLCDPGTPREHLVVLDFGVAQLAHADSPDFEGTPQYCAPEYIRTGAVSPAIDVYQMGLVLWEMLLGRAAVPEREQAAALWRHIQGLSLPPRLETSSLAPILRRALAVEPEDRFADAGEFADALESACGDVPTCVQPRDGASTLPDPSLLGFVTDASQSGSQTEDALPRKPARSRWRPSAVAMFSFVAGCAIATMTAQCG